jgi:molybdopterin converting factor small subunit
MKAVNVKVLYFASAQGLTGLQSETMSLAEGSSVKDMAREIIRLHPSLKSIQRTVRYSVNFVVAEEGEPLHEGDEVGILPPVAGG